ncbi:transcription factor bHLH18-like [Neltuma alba]|uniref:transcription factor bHLH18-like n=1 Tax=Neltuma alba TaxID=207710 RepID=UPI0010A36ED4|nr:transcription factor bHLH18-like [Prosopis alba]
MEYDDSFQTWLHDAEMELDLCTFFPEFCTEKMSSSSSSSLDVEVTANQREKTDHNHQLADQTLYHQTETNSIAPLTFSDASDGNLHVDAENRVLPAARKNYGVNCEIECDDGAMNKGQPEGDKWHRSSKKTALPLPQHIVVERKRRREINQRFLALSKVVPGNKKKDRASILGEAVKYMKDLQERIKKLEEKNKKKVVESVVFVKRSSSSSCPSSGNNQYYCNPSYEEPNRNDDSLSNRNKRRWSLLAEEEIIIEAKVIERSLLIRVHCGNHNAILPTLLAAISEFHLIVLTANAIPFGKHIDITVIAQMGVNFYMKTKDIVDRLRVALSNDKIPK